MSFLKKKGFVFCAGFGFLFALVLCMLLLLLAAFLTYKEVIDQDGEQIVACICAGCSVFGASFAISKFRGRQALPLGAVLASVFLLAAIIVRLGAEESAAMGPWLVYIAVAVFAGGLLGAVLAARKNTPARRRRRRK